MDLKRSILILLVLLVAAFPGWAGEPPGQWIVVAAPAFRAAVEPLAQHRKAQGLRVVELPPGDAAGLRDRIHEQCRRHVGPSYVLLVGAVDGDAATVVPTLRGGVGRMKGQPSDNGFGCPDKGELPTVAVGRLPARTVDEARAMVAKTLAFERAAKPGAWRRRVTVLVGHPGGPDEVRRAAAELLVEDDWLRRTDRFHPAWTVRALFHCPQSRFGVPDEQLRSESLRLLQDGQLLTVFAGHSAPEGFWSDGVPFLDRNDWGRLTAPGVLLSCGCFGCQVSGDGGEGYGQSAVRNPNGPVAVIGAHGESYAVFGKLAFDALAETLKKPDLPERLGEWWLAIKAGLGKGPVDYITFTALDLADGSKGKVPLAVQRREHLEMWLLLGDPALQLPQLPADIPLSATRSGQSLTVEGILPPRLAGAAVRVTLERPLSGAATGIEPLPEKNDPDRARRQLANARRSNDVVLAVQTGTATGGRFTCTLDLPPAVPWPRLIVRAHATVADGEGCGVAAVSTR